jgi:two-component system sensor histidine kinase/response regulator
MTDPAIDQAALDRLLDMVGGDLEFLDELVDTYLEDTPVQLAAMRAALAIGQVEDLVRPAHSLKTNSANMGAESLATMCRELEAAAREGAVDDAAGRVGAIEAGFGSAREQLLALRAAR